MSLSGLFEEHVERPALRQLWPLNPPLPHLSESDKAYLHWAREKRLDLVMQKQSAFLPAEVLLTPGQINHSRAEDSTARHEFPLGSRRPATRPEDTGRNNFLGS